ncbi:MAG: monovalent cation/H+ antiporter complex subunit F [Bacillota bacterium]
MILAIVMVLVVASAVGFWRVIIGPTVGDRIVAADCISILLTVAIVLLGLHYRNAMFLDVALVYAILLFADILVMSKYFEQGELHK